MFGFYKLWILYLIVSYSPVNLLMKFDLKEANKSKFNCYLGKKSSIYKAKFFYLIILTLFFFVCFSTSFFSFSPSDLLVSSCFCRASIVFALSLSLQREKCIVCYSVTLIVLILVFHQSTNVLIALANLYSWVAPSMDKNDLSPPPPPYVEHCWVWWGLSRHIEIEKYSHLLMLCD